MNQALAHLLGQSLSLFAFRIEPLVGDLEISGSVLHPVFQGLDVVAELLLEAHALRNVEQGQEQAVLETAGNRQLQTQVAVAVGGSADPLTVDPGCFSAKGLGVGEELGSVQWREAIDEAGIEGDRLSESEKDSGFLVVEFPIDGAK